MRIQSVKRSHESGIASTMVVLLAVALIGSAAFAVDFGIAYWNRNTLQAATDSGSLAAAKVIAEFREDANGDGAFGTCADVKADAAIIQEAYDAALEKASQNEWFAGVQPRQISPSDDKPGFRIICDDPSAPNSILVEFWADGDSPAVLGPIVGSGPVTTVAAAASEVGVPRSGFGLRPYFVCGNRVQKLKDEQGNLTGWVQLRYPDDETAYDEDAARTVSDASIDKNSTTLTSATAGFSTDDVGSQVVVVGADNTGGDLVTTIVSVTNTTTVEVDDKAGTDVTDAELTITPVDAGGSCFAAGGSWWTSDCPTDSNNGTLAENTQRGCLSEVAVVDTGTADPSDETSMLPILQSACASNSDDPEDCLEGNPGNVGATSVINAWDALLGTEIALPVFNNEWQEWLFDAAVGCGSGNNACYPIEELLAVRVCGYEWAGNKDNSSPDPECAGVAALLGTGGNDNFLYLKLVNVITGNVSGAFECPPGDPSCDSGLRAIRLKK